MRRAVLCAAVAVLTFAACGSDSSSGSPKSTTTVKPTTTTTAKKAAAKAVTIATKLGCTNPKATKAGDRLGLPRPLATVNCVVKGTVYHVDVYATHADQQRVFGGEAVKGLCAIRKALKLTGPAYYVSGDVFTVTANPPAVKKVVKAGTLAQAKAAGALLDLPVKTTECPA